ncbi:hypothetical protein MTsPCn9_34540 [Croceitalea sp. MTPC9]|uniref:hypothetical protein n=1 Tax=unclassified Croceitalea TaxID=2632280 RepID=UPI002B3968AF|nr:hypothetical protein MTsPCn6_34410 [Croceitalea sp. MTPC6]GMN18514.1 hypothetical protein MTsPCn9_34540 [Croceitalea sp. MTPC9]
MIEEFIEKLREIGTNPVVGEDEIKLEFRTKDVDLKLWKEATDKYIGSWKKMRMGIDHDIPNKILRFTIPFEIIGGEDYTFEQIVEVANRIAKRI